MEAENERWTPSEPGPARLKHQVVCEALARPQTLHLLYKSSVILDISSTRKMELLHGLTRDLSVTVLSVWTTEPHCHPGPERNWWQPAAGTYKPPPESSSLQIHCGRQDRFFSFYIHLQKKNTIFVLCEITTVHLNQPQNRFIYEEFFFFCKIRSLLWGKQNKNCKWRRLLLYIFFYRTVQ